MKCIRINQIKLPLTHSPEELEEKILESLRIKKENLSHYTIVKQSTDAREKRNIRYVYTVDVYLHNYKKVSKKILGTKAELITPVIYDYIPAGEREMQHRPVIVGMGPAGLFCAYYLAKFGYRPIVLERGESVDDRTETVNGFWKGEPLNPESNVQFGEGGAGTFSDGKLNTLVKDKNGRNREVLERFIQFGAKEEIRYRNKPHIGTDVLKKIVKNMRNEICSFGGEVRFGAKVTDILIEKAKDGTGRIRGVTINETETLETEVLVLAIGHSARDTFELLEKRGVVMTPKAFAVGLRVEHSQSMINRLMYGTDVHEILEAADYKVTYQTPEHGVYSFCMCPGGYVVNASSEEGRLAVNGMSYSDRAGSNANSAMVVTVTPKDYGTEHVLDGMYFQRKLEEAAYREGNGKVPVQCFGDFCKNRKTEAFGEIKPQMKGLYQTGNLRNVLPEQLAQPFMEAMHGCARQLPGFDLEDVVLSGVESRTSSPVRIERNEKLCALDVEDLYPCGEGAGYAGGITSAAMDGIRVFEAVTSKYRPMENGKEIK